MATWKWLLGALFLLGSAFCSGTETALTALGDVRARQILETGGRRGRLLTLWVEHPERILSTLLIGNTLVNIGLGALGGSVGMDLAAWRGWSAATTVTATTAIVTVVVLFLGEILPKTLAKRHPVRGALLTVPALRVLAWVLWPLSTVVTRLTSATLGALGGKPSASPAVTGEEIEYLIEVGTREGVLDAVKEELLNSVLEFADRVAKEVMVPRTRMVAIDVEAPPDELVRVVTENPYSRMPVYQGSIDNVIGILLVRDIVPALRADGGRGLSLERTLKPAFFVPEQMKISRLLKEMQRRKTHIAVVVDEFGGTSGLVTLEDVIEEIVGEIQDEADAEAAPVKPLGEGQWIADAAVPLHDLEEILNAHPPGDSEASAGSEVRFPEEGDYETLGGFVTATAGRVPPVGSELRWDGLVFTVRAGDERRVTRVEIARRAESAPAPAMAAVRG